MNLFGGPGDEWVVATTETRQPEVEDVSAWVASARSGDSEAYCRVARSLEARLYRQALSWCRDERSAEDLAAEAIVEGWRSLQRFDGTCRISTWLHAILFRRYLKWLRHARSRPVSLANLLPEEAGEGERLLGEVRGAEALPGEGLVEAEAAERLWRAIRQLPEAHQQVVVLRFYEEASLGEIASALDVSVGTVKSRLHYALDKLRRSADVVNLFREGR